jgi:hypothetical protein
MVQYLLFMMSFGMSSVTWYTYLRCSALVTKAQHLNQARNASASSIIMMILALKIR